ncbi:MAG: hypothetical protein Q9211_002938 [Gyalolechia sp. 1 TL-2023]
MASEQGFEGNRKRKYEDIEDPTIAEQHHREEHPSTRRFLDLETPPASPPAVDVVATNERLHPDELPSQQSRLPIEAAIPRDVDHLLDHSHPANIRRIWIPAIQEYMRHKAALFRLYRLEKTHRLATACQPLPMHPWGFNDREEPAPATGQDPPPPQHKPFNPSPPALAHRMPLTVTGRSQLITSDPRSPLNRNPMHDLPAGLSAVFPLPEPSLNRYQRQ